MRVDIEAVKQVYALKNLGDLHGRVFGRSLPQPALLDFAIWAKLGQRVVPFLQQCTGDGGGDDLAGLRLKQIQRGSEGLCHSVWRKSHPLQQVDDRPQIAEGTKIAGASNGTAPTRKI